jgi:heavy metal efflux system protein
MNRYILCIITVFIFTNVFGQNNKPITLTLSDAISTGLNENPQLKSAVEKIKSAKGRYWNGISLPMPEISKNFEYVPKGKSLNTGSEKSFEISQSFDFPTNYFLKGSKLNREIEIAENEYQQIKVSLIAQIKTAYYNLLAKEIQQKIANENLAIAEDFYKKAEIRSKIGEGTHLEKLTARVQASEARNNLEIRKNSVKNALMQLKYFLGNCNGNDNKNYQLVDSLPFYKLDLSFDDLCRETQKDNPQLKIGQLSIDIAARDNSLAWSSLLPNFNISYYKQTLDGNSDYYGAAFGITVPLWFLFDQRGQIQESEANLQIAEEENQLLKNELHIKLSDAFNNYQNAEKQVELYNKEILPQAEEIFRIAQKSYEAGEINYMEYLQSKSTFINSKIDYIETLLTFNNCISALEQTAGIDLSNRKQKEN